MLLYYCILFLSIQHIAAIQNKLFDIWASSSSSSWNHVSASHVDVPLDAT